MTAMTPANVRPNGTLPSQLHQPNILHRRQLPPHPRQLGIRRPGTTHEDALVLRAAAPPVEAAILRVEQVGRPHLPRLVPRLLRPEPPRLAFGRVERTKRVVRKLEPPRRIGHRRPPVRLPPHNRHPHPRQTAGAAGPVGPVEPARIRLDHLAGIRDELRVLHPHRRRGRGRRRRRTAAAQHQQPDCRPAPSRPGPRPADAGCRLTHA